MTWPALQLLSPSRVPTTPVPMPAITTGSFASWPAAEMHRLPSLGRSCCCFQATVSCWLDVGALGCKQEHKDSPKGLRTVERERTVEQAALTTDPVLRQNNGALSHGAHEPRSSLLHLGGSKVEARVELSGRKAKMQLQPPLEKLPCQAPCVSVYVNEVPQSRGRWPWG